MSRNNPLASRNNLSSPSKASNLSNMQAPVAAPPPDTLDNPLSLLSDSDFEDEPVPARLPPSSGTKKRPIDLTSDSEPDQPAPKKQKQAHPRQKKQAHPQPQPQLQSPARLNLTLTIPENPYPRARAPKLLAHYPATTTTTSNSEGNFTTPKIATSARVTSLLRACPLLNVTPTTLPRPQQLAHEAALSANRAATNAGRGQFFAWRSFAHASRDGREAMVLSGLDSEDVEAEFGWEEENGLPEWKKPFTGLWRDLGGRALERLMPEREGVDGG
ncbi:hypothetical protein BU23DRAFT_563946 [Bimuria novae-zelandiae CBS 107.79]|uniref:Uncharacterized protein n=1 Tax=Bimuria novae-zelandiae CBS 107.79 TaxID=1447943 RepID=A0A6A5VP84_9PLEO|nr:hypothetical protein BU23DRAFT_563946 [Bimuria novae-zelandiae CBS 107.79]